MRRYDDFTHEVFDECHQCGRERWMQGRLCDDCKIHCVDCDDMLEDPELLLEAEPRCETCHDRWLEDQNEQTHQEWQDEMRRTFVR